MSPAVASHSVLVSRQAAWARFRVRGLLRSPSLAARLAGIAPPPAEVRVATGTVRVAIGPGRGEAFWIRRLDAAVEAWLADDGARPRRPAAPPPVGPRRRAGAAGTLRAAEPAADDVVHATPVAGLLATLGEGEPIDPGRGLDPARAAARLARDGANEIRDVTGRSAAQILAAQFGSVPVGLLGASAALALGTRAFADAGAITAVLAANATLGFVTERSAERTVASLRRLAPRQATVLRGGTAVAIDAREVVVGDVLLLEPGVPVAADARVIDAHRLATNEAALTGESLPVRKRPVDALPAAAPLGERANMVFMGTVVSGGIGRAVVVATAARTALGRIRHLAQAAEAPRTRLQEELDVLGRRLALGAATLCAGTFAVGLLRGRPALPLLRTAVSLGVAAIPEGLPTVATSLLAASVRSLQQRQVYARRLDAIESLGAIDTVCLDKTGTLTQNRMSVAAVTLGRRLVEPLEPGDAVDLPEPWLRVAALCNSVEPAEAGPGGDAAAATRWQGSSTEIALLEFAIGEGFDADAVRERQPAIGVRHRSEHHPYMVTLHDDGPAGLWVAVKGRPDEVLARCDRWHDGTRTRRLAAADRRALHGLNERMAAHGHRVLALAYRQHPGRDYGDTAALVWLGLVGLADPLRPGLPEMVGRFEAAGIRPLMITGDQPGTALAVARAIGLDGEESVVDAASLPESAPAIADIVERTAAFARTSPAMKLEIVRALQSRGHVVAMTGDGINDGPALRIADVGVAMGVTGTDFAHSMSDLVLREDHPAAILHAIEEGRTAFVNIRKSVRYLVATNVSELAATALAVTAGLPEPFEPMQLLWTNLATDIWPAIALGLEPAEPGILERPPVSLRDGLVDRGAWRSIAVDAGAMTVAALASFGYGLARYGAGPRARTLAFMTLTTGQLLYSLSMRSERPLRIGGLRPNPALRHGIAWLLAAQAGTVLLPSARRLLRTGPLAIGDVAIVAVGAVAPVVLREALKERAWRTP